MWAPMKPSRGCRLASCAASTPRAKRRATDASSEAKSHSSQSGSLMLNVGIIGYGYWGPNLVRNFMACDRTNVAAVCDQSPERLTKVGAIYPGVALTSSAAELIADP